MPGSIVLDSKKRPLVVYNDEAAGQVGLLHCGTASCNEGNTVGLLDILMEPGSLPKLRVDRQDRPLVMYTRTIVRDPKLPAEKRHSVFLQFCNQALANRSACQSNMHTELLYPDADAADFELDKQDIPTVVIADSKNHSLKFLRCMPGCGAGRIVVTDLSEAGEATQWLDLTLDVAGNPVIAYFGLVSRHLKVLRCGDPGCASEYSVMVADPTVVAGGQASIVLDSHGRPVVAYIGAYPREVRLLQCGDVNCTDGNRISTLEATTEVGHFVSLVLDPDDRPIVSFKGGDSGSSRLLRCLSTTCLLAKTIAELDPASFEPASLVLNGEGNPLVAYVTRQYELRVTSCGTFNCLPEIVTPPEQGKIEPPGTGDGGLRSR